MLQRLVNVGKSLSGIDFLSFVGVRPGIKVMLSFGTTFTKP